MNRTYSNVLMFRYPAAVRSADITVLVLLYGDVVVLKFLIELE